MTEWQRLRMSLGSSGPMARRGPDPLGGGRQHEHRCERCELEGWYKSQPWTAPKEGCTENSCRNGRQLLGSVNASFQWSAEEAVLANYYWNSSKRGHLPADTDQHTRKADEEKISDEQLSAVSGKAIGSPTCAFVQAYRPSSDTESEQNTHHIRFPGSNIAARCPQISGRSAAACEPNKHPPDACF